MLLAAMLAMVLAAAAPAFAQTAVAGSVQYVDCDQIQAAIGQYQNADAEDFSAVAQELGVDQNQVLACFQSVAAGRDIHVHVHGFCRWRFGFCAPEHGWRLGSRRDSAWCWCAACGWWASGAQDRS